MTAINFMFNAETVVVAMDTLSISAEDRTPYKFISKIFPLPHLQSVMCGTGNLDLILEWYTTIQKNVISYDIDYFSDLTSDTLKKLKAKYPSEATTTIYQFGYSHEKKPLGVLYIEAPITLHLKNINIVQHKNHKWILISLGKQKYMV